MPFRQKAKNLFKTKSRSDSLSKTSTTASDGRDRYPSNVYAPGEPMPRPKYRMPPKKEHKEALEAFSFAGAWRKRSFHSTYSPGGTRAPSRRNSFLSRKSRPGSRANSRPVSRANSYNGTPNGGGGGAGGAEVPSAGAGLRQREGLHPVMTTQQEQDGDDDVGNVGLSRVQSRERPSQPLKAGIDKDRDQKPNGYVPPGVTAHDHQPFSEQELTLAMQRSRLTVSAR